MLLMYGIRGRLSSERASWQNRSDVQTPEEDHNVMVIEWPDAEKGHLLDEGQRGGVGSLEADGAAP